MRCLLMPSRSQMRAALRRDDRHHQIRVIGTAMSDPTGGKREEILALRNADSADWEYSSSWASIRPTRTEPAQ
jgi:hypothetical protein